MKFVPGHIHNTENLIDRLNDTMIDNDKDLTFISLDVKNLYPSIPIMEAITEIMKFLKINWDKINSYGICIESVEKMLKFVSYNYEISYNGKHYLQIKGCPMGAHFGPPFAVLFMNSVEKIALERL